MNYPLAGMICPALFVLLLSFGVLRNARAQEHQTAPNAPGPSTATALDRYVSEPDEAYGWKLVETIEEDKYSGYVVELTSQSWRNEDEVNRTVWKHWLTIIKPESTTTTSALLYITHGDNDDAVPKSVPDRLLRIAMETNSVVAQLGMVPNQPLSFADSRGHQRYEDDLIAYSRVKFMMTGDPKWLVRLPMVKSGVRAMDAVQEFMASPAGGELTINKFVVAGASKRGWTTWLVGLMDKRVIGMMPLVIDALNTEAITRHHYAAYGFFSPALGDYVRHSIYPHKLGSPEFAAVLKITDPYMYRYRERMKIPKYVINASGDQYFLPDNSHFYFQALPEKKLLRYVPNTKHNLAGSDAQESMIAFSHALIHNRTLPSYTWRVGDDGAIVVSSPSEPREVKLWQASNPNTRDFRLGNHSAV